MSLYATMLKTAVHKARARVRARYTGAGSIKAESIETGCEGIDCELLLESDEPPERIAKLARVSESGCFVIQSLLKPSPVTMRVLLNGNVLEDPRDLS